uniref:Uncharacterized protein n=1 Tax=Rhizophora mucronata TaxID=61149 RepID=A0A2P2NVL0_RHIMU
MRVDMEHIREDFGATLVYEETKIGLPLVREHIHVIL